jgi:hypothetical protein
MTGSPPLGYAVGKGPFGKSNSLPGKDDEVRRKLIKFHLGDSNSRTLDIRDLDDVQELVERALRKFNVALFDNPPEMDEALCVSGWGVFVGTDSEGMS